MEDHGLDDRRDAPAPQDAAAPARDRADAVSHRSLSAVRHWARSLSFTGLVFAWVFFLISLTPSLLPRSWLVQGFVAGFALAQGYGLGVAIAWAARHLGVPRASARRRALLVFAALAAVSVLVMLVLGWLWASRIRHAVTVPGTGPYLYPGTFLIALGLAAAIIGLARLIHELYLALARRLRRFLPGGAARVVATVLIVALGAGVAMGFADQVLLRVTDMSFSAINNGSDVGVSRPASALRSGSPASPIRWGSLGRQGREFVSTGPTATQIERFTSRPAVQPIRVYAGLESARTLQGEANLVLSELKRTGAFHRALIGLAVPTGRGSVYAALADPLEYMYGGDTAIASIQFSYLPSWLAFLTQRPQAAAAGRALFNTVYAYWVTLPPAHRPLLVVFGESLGAYGAASTFSTVADIRARTSGALFVGPPSDTPVWRELTDARAPGSPERLPVYGTGRAVRFAASAGDLRWPDGALRHPHIVFLQHASDPVVWWSTSLLWHKPDWLIEPRAPDVTPQMQWFPFVTFWQVSADLIVSSTTPGYGHFYAPEAPAAWAAILHPAHWTPAETAKLAAMASADTLP